MYNMQEDLLVLQCFCTYGGSALLGGVRGVSRSVECEVLPVLSYSGFFF